MHRKIPRFQLAHPGFLAPQSAQVEFPGCRNKSCSSRSFRACSRLLRDAIVDRMYSVSVSAELQPRAKYNRDDQIRPGGVEVAVVVELTQMKMLDRSLCYGSFVGSKVVETLQDDALLCM